MGNCIPQCFEFENELDAASAQEDLETRRQRQAEAAIQRQRQQESRGVKNPELLKAKQARREEIEKKAAANSHGTGGGLRFKVDC